MENYFVVLEIPGGIQHKTQYQRETENFWKRAATAIANGKARLVSRRQDTGAAEDIRMHAGRANRFKTYVLVNLHLDPAELVPAILKKAAKRLSAHAAKATIIDTSHNFQLLTVEA